MTLWWFNLCLAESFGRHHHRVGLLRALVHLVIARWRLWRELWTYIYCLDHQGMTDLSACNFKLPVDSAWQDMNRVSISCLSVSRVSKSQWIVVQFLRGFPVLCVYHCRFLIQIKPPDCQGQLFSFSQI